MRSKFRLEVDVVLGDDEAANVIEVARQHVAAEGQVAMVRGTGVVHVLRPEEFIDGIEDALLELLQCNPLLDTGRVGIERVSCRSIEGPCPDRAEN